MEETINKILEETNKSLKENQGKTIKQVNQTVQNLKTEREGNREIRNQGNSRYKKSV